MRSPFITTLLLLLSAISVEAGFKLPFKLPWQKKKPATDASLSPTSPAIISPSPPPTCTADDSCVSRIRATCSGDVDYCAAEFTEHKPADGQFVIDPAGQLSEATFDLLMANLTKFNRTKGNQGLRCYLVVYPSLPILSMGGDPDKPVQSARDFAKGLLREWFSPRADRTILIVMLTANKRMEVSMGSRAKRKLKDSAARRIARKVQPKLPDNLDDAAKMAVKDIIKHLTKEKGIAGNLRSVLMPIVVVMVLGFMYLRNAGSRGPPSRMDMPGGIGGMPGMEGGADFNAMMAQMGGGLGGDASGRLGIGQRPRGRMPGFNGNGTHPAMMMGGGFGGGVPGRGRPPPQMMGDNGDDDEDDDGMADYTFVDEPHALPSNLAGGADGRFRRDPPRRPPMY